MYAIRIIGLATMIFLSGCGNTTETRPDWCLQDSLILPSRSDQLSPGTARYIKTIMKREGFNFSQTLNWIVRKAMNEDKSGD